MDTKSRKELVDGIVKYLKSEHWTHFLNYHLENPETEIWHSHIYVETSIHPESLVQIIENFFHARGQEIVRKIDFLKSGRGYGALHNIHPAPLPHFDLFFRFNQNQILSPMPKENGESGQNAISWGKKHIDEFYRGFEFKTIGPNEECQIRNYFKSRHWKQALNLIMDPDVIHLHCNLRISFDPKILELIAREVLADQGWTIDRVVPNIFNVRGKYRGKLVFLGAWPEKVYDIGWLYDPDVVIAPSYEPWLRDNCPPGFDWCLTSEFNAFIAGTNYIKLTNEESKQVASEFWR